MRIEEARLAWLERLENLADEAETMVSRTPYGFARYGGKLRPVADALADLYAALMPDKEGRL